MDESGDERTEIVRRATKQLGSKYKYGSRGPKTFDCSGLVEYVYSPLGYSLKGSSKYMSQMGANIPIKKAQPGDLIFFQKSGGDVFHVSIITSVSDDSVMVIHSTSSKGVINDNILSSPYWKNKIHKVISLTSLH